jgi:hypothetical protein
LILVDSSVWIDYFKGTITEQTEKLDGLGLSSYLCKWPGFIATFGRSLQAERGWGAGQGAGV